MATTAGDQINAALRLLGILAEGETPSSEISSDALDALNQMIDSWSTERLVVFATEDQEVSWPAGSATVTLGPSGTSVGNRPISVDSATYFTDPANLLSFGIKLVNQQQYNAIALKSVVSTYPQVMWAQMGYPDITLTVYPIPATPVVMHVVSVQELTQPATLATELAFPPGYLRAFKYNLACEIAPEFGVEPAPTIQRIAMTSKRNLKRVNNPDDVMNMPYSMVANRQRYNVYANNY